MSAEMERDLYKELLGVRKPANNPGKGGYFGDGIKRPFPKTQVEECVILSSLDMVKAGVIRRLEERTLKGELLWGKKNPVTIEFESSPFYLRLFYSIKDQIQDEYTNIDHTIPIQWEEKGRPKDGYIYFKPIFICPGKDDSACGIKAYNLYLPPGEKLFFCRKCHNLSYRSEQEKTEREARKFFKAVGLL